MDRRQQAGFSLIELMVVVAIIGVLAAVAVPAYNDYIKTSNMAKIVVHEDEARRYVRNEYARLATRAAIGRMPDGVTLADLVAAFHASLLDTLNAEGKVAPGGSLAYAAAANDVAGVVGVDPLGSSALDFRVEIVTPAYGDLSGGSVTIMFRGL